LLSASTLRWARTDVNSGFPGADPLDAEACALREFRFHGLLAMIYAIAGCNAASRAAVKNESAAAGLCRFGNRRSNLGQRQAGSAVLRYQRSSAEFVRRSFHGFTFNFWAAASLR
jgi:hypothetical protein